MRDIFLGAVFFGSLPAVLARPWLGVLLLCWFGYMNPHRLCYGFALLFPFVAIATAVTVVGMFISSESRGIAWTKETSLLLAFIVWMNITTVFALNQADAWYEWDRTMKIQFTIFITLALIRDRLRLDALVWTIALSLGFYGVKGGLWAIATGGSNKVQGPQYTFINDNNTVALALVMTIPLLRYLQLRSESKIIRLGLSVALVLTTVAVLVTYSRGGVIALVAVGGLLWLKSRKKVLIGLLIVACIPVFYNFLPQAWYDRMSTIRTYREDNSALGRLNAWQFAYNIATERPIVGGGYRVFTEDLFRKYAPDPEDFHDAHSIYFEVLGEQGFVGLFLFLALGATTWFTASRIIREAKRDPALTWARDLVAMVQVSLAGYAVGGAFVGLAYYDLPYHLLSIVMITKHIIRQPQPEPVAMEDGRDEYAGVRQYGYQTENAM
jgi:probable O-glycosylation ligase (exosortase A-associated)